MSYARTAVTRMTLDMSRPDLQRSETVTLGDTNRRWEVTLINGGAPFRLPPNWTAALTGIKPDGTGLLNGCSVADGKIIYDFAAGKEIATCVGGYPVQFDIWDEVGDLVASPKVYVNVLADVRPSEGMKSEAEYGLLGDFISQKNELIGDIDDLKAKITTAGTVTIHTTQWSYTTPHTAYMGFPSNTVQKGQAVLFMPLSDATKEAAAKARLSVGVDEVTDGGGDFTDYVLFVQAEECAVPTVDLDLGYIVLRTAGDLDAMVALIGVDSYGEGRGTASGVDEEAVKALIDKEVPEWARSKTKPTYTPEEVKARPATWTPTAEEIGARPSTWMPTAAEVGARPNTWKPTAIEVGADPANTAQTLVNDLASKTAKDLANYYTKDQTLTKDEINTLVSAIPKFKIEVVTSLPSSNISETTVYLVKSGADSSNLYTEYIRANGAWERLGTQTVDLTGYATVAWVNDILAFYVKTVDMEAYVTEVLTGYLTKEDAAKTYLKTADADTKYVAKVSGKGLSTNDYTNDDKAKVAAALTQHQSLAHLLPKDQGTANAGKLMAVGEDGQVVYIDAPAGSDIIGNFTEDGGIELYKDLPMGTYTLYTVDSDGNRIKYATMTVTESSSSSYTNILTSGDATVHPNQRWSGSEKSLYDCDGMICVEIPASAVNGKTLYFKGFTKGLFANSQGSVWMAVNADNTLNGRLLQTSSQGNVWTCAALVYDDATTVGSLKIDSSTFAGIASAAKLCLNIAVYESAAITTLPDTLIMTIEEPIE